MASAGDGVKLKDPHALPVVSQSSTASLEISWVVRYKRKHRVSMCPRSVPKSSESTWPQNDLSPNILSSFICNSPRPERTQMSVNSEWNCVVPQLSGGAQVSSNKGQLLMGQHVSECRGQDAEPDIRDYILCDSMHMHFQKRHIQSMVTECSPPLSGARGGGGEGEGRGIIENHRGLFAVDGSRYGC